MEGDSVRWGRRCIGEYKLSSHDRFRSGAPDLSRDGRLVSEDYSRFWNTPEIRGALIPLGVKEDGSAFSEGDLVSSEEGTFEFGVPVWTGTNLTGRSRSGLQLASGTPIMGKANGLNQVAISAASGFTSCYEAHYYGMSEILTVPTPGDINGDGNVQMDDFLILAEHFGERGPLSIGEINGDGVVNFPDFLFWQIISVLIVNRM